MFKIRFSIKIFPISIKQLPWKNLNNNNLIDLLSPYPNLPYNYIHFHCKSKRRKFWEVLIKFDKKVCFRKQY